MSIKNKYLYIIAIITLLMMSGIGWGIFDQNNKAHTRYKHLNGIPILMYHKVNPNPFSGGLGLRVRPIDFDWEMHYLKENGYHTVNLGNVVDHYQKGKKLPAKPIVITFDDGYQDNYTYALPILKKYGFTATVFVVTNTIGGINKFDCITHIEPKNKMLNWAQIREMNANGIIIGSHTLDHWRLTHISRAEAKRQIVASKKVLERGLGKKVQYFCYPYGDVSPSIAKLVQESGYKAATTINPRATSRMNPYMLSRMRVTGHYNHQRFIAELNRYKNQN